MKNLVKTTALIALLALGALLTVTCGDSPGDTPGGTGDPLLPGTLVITPASGTTGSILTATYSPEGDEAVSLQWRRGNTNLGDPVAANTSTLTAEIAGSYTVAASAEGFRPKTSNTATITAPGPNDPTNRLNITINRSAAGQTPNQFVFSVGNVAGATSYVVKVGGTTVHTANSPTNITVASTHLSNGHNNFTPMTVQAMNGATLMSMETNLVGMVKYPAANNVVLGYTDWFHVIITGLDELYKIHEGTATNHLSIYAQATNALQEDNWNTNEFAASEHDDKRVQLNFAMRDILGTHFTTIRNSIPAGSARDAFDACLRRLWFNNVITDTGAGNANALLNNIIQQQARTAAGHNDITLP